MPRLSIQYKMVILFSVLFAVLFAAIFVWIGFWDDRLTVLFLAVFCVLWLGSHRIAKSVTNQLAEERNAMQKTIKKSEQEIQYRAYYDALTGLVNRGYFQSRLTETLKNTDKNKSHLAVLAMDLDRFKEINDTLGYQTGDQLLRQVSQRLTYHFKNINLIARMGSNEFALLLPYSSVEEAIKIAEQVDVVFNKPFNIAGMQLELTVRIGIALFPEHAKNATLLLQKANIAMEQARDEKHHFRVYDQELDKHSVYRLSLMGELKNAIKNNELILHYQPKVDLKTHQVVETEALVRWIHPKHGLISPLHFIPLAEQTGHVRHLTQWALQTAVKQCYEWQCGEIPLKVAVNISTVDLMDLQLVQQLKTLLRDIPINPERLVLEVTESTIMKDPRRSLAVLSELHAMGIKLSIDDFGTGYSSMTQLKKMPVDEIKIDRSFITHILVDKNDAVIVKSTIELAHNMGLKVVAEGVDDVKIFEALEALQCDAVQGHYISQPLSITSLSLWLIQSPFKLAS